MEVLAAAADEADAGVEASDDEDGGEQNAPKGPEEGGDEPGEGLRTVLAAGERAPRKGADMGEHGVDGQQDGAGEPAGTDGAAHDGAVVRNAARADVEGDDDAEVERGDRVHRLVADKKPLAPQGWTRTRPSPRRTRPGAAGRSPER